MPGSGLEGELSDYVGRISVAAFGARFSHAMRFAQKSGAGRRHESTLSWRQKDRELTFGHVLARDAPLAPGRRQQTYLRASIAPLPNWAAQAEFHYDLHNNRPLRTKVGLVYGDICTQLRVSYSREHNSLNGENDFSSFTVSVTLKSFATNADGGEERPFGL